MACCCSVAKSCLTLCDPHGLRPARPPCPSPSLRVCPNSGPLSWWYCLTISCSAASLSFCLQSFPVLGAFPMSGLFAWGGQSVEASASALVLPKNIQEWFPLGVTGLISLLSKGLSRAFSTTIQKHQFFSTQPSLQSNSLSYMPTGKTIALTTLTFVSTVMSLLALSSFPLD